MASVIAWPALSGIEVVDSIIACFGKLEVTLRAALSIRVSSHCVLALWKSQSYPTTELLAVRGRLAELLPISDAFRGYYQSAGRDNSSLSIADQFFYDVRSITEEQRNEISNNFGTEGLVVLMICLALYDGAFRIISVLDH